MHVHRPVVEVLVDDELGPILQNCCCHNTAYLRARFWCIIWVCTCNFTISIWSSPNATYVAAANKYFVSQLAPKIMHQILAVILRQFCSGKISFIVMVPGQTLRRRVGQRPLNRHRSVGIFGRSTEKNIFVRSSRSCFAYVEWTAVLLVFQSAIPGLFLFIFVFSTKYYNFYSKYMWKLSILSMVLGFEPTTFSTWVSSNNHWTRSPIQQFYLFGQIQYWSNRRSVIERYFPFRSKCECSLDRVTNLVGSKLNEFSAVRIAGTRRGCVTHGLIKFGSFDVRKSSWLKIILATRWYKENILI